MNKVILVGRLVKDPESRYSANGTCICTFTLAVDRNYTNQNGERETDFLNIKVFKNRAENCIRYLTKGSMVAIDGNIQTGSYVDTQGNKKYTVDILANEVKFLITNNNKSKEDFTITEEEIDEMFNISDEDFEF